MKLSILILLLVVLRGFGAAFEGTALLHFESGANGDPVTAALMSNAVSGTFNNWTLSHGAGDAEESLGTATNLFILTDAEKDLFASVDINGTRYSGQGTRGYRAVMHDDYDGVIRHTFASAPAALSVGFFFRWNGNSINYAPRDIWLAQTPGGNFQVLQIYDQGSGRPYYQTHHQGAMGNGNNVDFYRNTWYWVTILTARAGGEMKITFYDCTNNYASMGESVGTIDADTENPTYISFGIHKYGYTGQSVDFDNMIINTNGLYPLGPNGGPLIPESRMVDWTQCGIPGGIPIRSTIWTNVAGISTTAETNVAGVLQTLIDTCPLGQVIKLPEGRFLLTSALSLDRTITLRGSGRNTVLVANTAGNGITIESTVLSGNAKTTNLYSGYTKGSTNLTLLAADSTLNAGFHVTINQLNDGALVYNGDGQVSEGIRTDITPEADGLRCLNQTVEIKSITNGTNLVIWPPLVWTLTNTLDPHIFYRPSSSTSNNYVWHAGVEDLTITNIHTDGVRNIEFNRAAYCWATNIWSYNVGTGGSSAHIMTFRGYRNQIEGVFCSGQISTGAGSGYGIALEYQSSSTLIQNNILSGTRQFITINSGCSANAVAYNYHTNALANTDAASFTVHTGGHHSAHPIMNLYEGNVTYKMNCDFYFGSASHTTLLRNHFKGLMPYSSQAGAALVMDSTNAYFNVVGNLLGYSGITNQGGFTTWKTHVISPVTIDYGNDYNSIRVGYWSDGTDGGSKGFNGTNQWNTHILAQNYDYVVNSALWLNTTTNSGMLIDSYLYASAPSWWGTNRWPAIDPTSAVLAAPIPAEVRFASMGEDAEPGPDPPAAGTVNRVNVNRLIIR